MYKVIDLFCGVGGFTYGFEMSNNFEVFLGIDKWDTALETFQINHKNTQVLKSDLSNLDIKQLNVFKKNVDVIIAGPPCQGFSMAGKRDINDERNTLFEEVIRISDFIKPKVIVIENVKGLLSMVNSDNKPIFELIINSFNSIGYKSHFKILNAADFGVPQKRERVFFIASKEEFIDFPKPYLKENEYVTVGEALGNIPNDSDYYLPPKSNYEKLMQGKYNDNYIFNNGKMNHSKLIVERMSYIPQGGNWKNIPEYLGQGGGKHSNNYRRLDNNKPSITIKHVQKSMIVHPIYNRVPTIREVARLQSFNDDFKILGSKTDQHQQLANAVPPLLGLAISNNIKEYLDNV